MIPGRYRHRVSTVLVGRERPPDGVEVENQRAVVVELLEVALEPDPADRRLAGQDVRVLATDIAPQMVAEARRLAAERGLTRVRLALAEAESLPFAADSLDLVDLILAFQDEFSTDDNPVEISDEDAETLLKVQDAITFLKGKGVPDD